MAKVAHKISAQHQDGARIVGRATIIGGREHSDELSRSETLEAIHDAFVGADDHLSRETGDSGDERMNNCGRFNYRA